MATRTSRLFAASCALAGLSGCAAPAPAPSGEMPGFGTPGVESMLPAGAAPDLASLLRYCDAAAPASPAVPRPRSLAAACDQLRRTRRNQPGNAAPPVGE